MFDNEEHKRRSLLIQEQLRLKNLDSKGFGEDLSKPGMMDLFPIPSFTGLCFAVSAATLPLLNTKDPTLAFSVYKLISLAAPFIVEPFHVDSLHNCLDSISYSRLQHLLSRIEQVILSIYYILTNQ